jgi:hypothetical protein
MSAERRERLIGRWTPVLLYGLIVAGWLVQGLQAEAHDRLWLAILTLPAPALYVWRTRRRAT